MAFGGYDGSVRIKADLNHVAFDRGLAAMTGKVQTFGNTLKKISGVVAVAFGTAALIRFSKESVKAASALNDAWIGLESIVSGQGKSFSKAKDFINDYISDGLVPLENAVTAYKNLAARGYSTEQIEQLMRALKDSASFGRQSSYTLGQAVQTATEGLKNENSILVDNAGVTKNVSVMWREYAQSIGVGEKSLTLAQRRQAEVNGILKETRFQTGDAAKLVNTYSGQIAMLGYNFQQLKVKVGNALIPIAQAVLPSINAIIAGLTRLADVFAQVTAMLFGKSAQVTAATGIASSAASAADATDGLAEATANAGNASKQAAKDMKGVLAGFDELNILADNASSSVDGAAGGFDDLNLPEITPGGELFGDTTINLEIENGLQAIIDKAKELASIFAEGFKFSFGDVDFSGIKKSLQTIRGYLREIFTDSDVMAAANRFIESFVFAVGTMVGRIASIGTTIVSAVLGGIEVHIAENGDRIKDWVIRIFDVGTEINELLSNFSAAFAEVFSVFGEENAQGIVASAIGIFSDIFGGVIERASKFARDVIDTITAPFVENKDHIVEALRGFLEPVRTVMEDIGIAVRAVVDGIVALYDEHIHPFIMTVKEAFTEWFRHVLDGFNQYIKPVLDDFAVKFDDVVKNHVVPMVEKAIEAFGKVADKIQVIWEHILKPVVSWIIDTAVPFIAVQLAYLGDRFGVFLSVVSDVVGGIFEVLSGLIDFLTGVFTGDWKLALDGVKEIFRGAWNGIVGLLERAVNFIIAGLNRLISALNILHIDVPSTPWTDAFTIGFDIPSFEEIRLPRLANGAVIPPNQQFAAILGDQRSGMNVEAPLATIEKAVENAMSRMGGGDIRITVESILDGKVIARNTVRHINSMTRSSGRSPLYT